MLNVIVFSFFLATFKVVFPECTCGDALEHTTSQSAAQAAEMKNTELVQLFLFSDRVSGISVIHRFHFPPSRSDPSHSDPELWRSRKCHW